MALVPHSSDCGWMDAQMYNDAESQFHQNLSKVGQNNVREDSLTGEVQRARQQLREKLQNSVGDMTCQKNSLIVIQDRLQKVEAENGKLKDVITNLTKRLASLETVVKKLEPQAAASIPKKTPPKALAKKEDDLDLFDSDSEDDDAAKKLREERLSAYNSKKTKKPALIAKSNIIFDVKPWTDETDMKALEAFVRSVKHDGLLWGAAKLVPLAYGINKLQITSVIEDDKVSVDWLQEVLEDKGSELVQSVDIAAFNKI